MAAEHSFDIVSKINLQELRNAIQQAQKELVNRFDFKGSSAGVTLEEEPLGLRLTADHDVQLRSVVDVVQGKLAKRGVSLKSFTWAAMEAIPSGAVKQHAEGCQGLSSDTAREVVKAIKGLGLKVQPRIEGDTVRVSGKQIDELQAVVQMLTARDFGVPIQVENYR